jgi:hypothetical protein
MGANGSSQPLTWLDVLLQLLLVCHLHAPLVLEVGL